MRPAGLHRATSTLHPERVPSANRKAQAGAVGPTPCAGVPTKPLHDRFGILARLDFHTADGCDVAAGANGAAGCVRGYFLAPSASAELRCAASFPSSFDTFFSTPEAGFAGTAGAAGAADFETGAFDALSEVVIAPAEVTATAAASSSGFIKLCAFMSISWCAATAVKTEV